ncbi:MAG: helix-turn-helix transcriptional regulator [Actinobacteria bacterium]|nr:helix-turn-helix transcriptional regulator [Actinomycetota bacterium]MCA1720160.1 helix-turn-helix transcriptional regulator [Actinomycetota bacterium]
MVDVSRADVLPSPGVSVVQAQVWSADPRSRRAVALLLGLHAGVDVVAVDDVAALGGPHAVAVLHTRSETARAAIGCLDPSLGPLVIVVDGDTVDLAALQRKSPWSITSVVPHSTHLEEAALAVQAAVLGLCVQPPQNRGNKPLTSNDDGLTAREREVLSQLASGDDARAIARRLGVSVSTVRTHIKHMMEKYEVHTQLQLVLAAARAGVVTIGLNPDTSLWSRP